MKRTFLKKCFQFTVGSTCRVKRFTTGFRNSLKDVRKSQMIPEQVALVRKWLRQESKDFYAACFVVKQWDKSYQCWWRLCREMNVFPRFEYHMFYVLYIFVTYLLTLPPTLHPVSFLALYFRTHILMTSVTSHTRWRTLVPVIRWSIA
jgi:hypothetical protein